MADDDDDDEDGLSVLEASVGCLLVLLLVDLSVGFGADILTVGDRLVGSAIEWWVMLTMGPPYGRTVCSTGSRNWW